LRNLGSTLDAVARRCVLRQTEQLLCWSGMTDTEHSTTSGSNEEEQCWHNMLAITSLSNIEI